MKANFFWKGQDFQFLNRLAILSHIIVGHKVVIWISGPAPENKYWVGNIPGIKIRDANDVVFIDSFFHSMLERYSVPKRLRIASDMWQFVFLYRRGGLYCDTDVIALKKFPNMEWIISRDSEDHEERFALGIIKAPPRHSVFKYCIENVRGKWGSNTRVFSEAIKKYGLGLTHPKEVFHPFSCGIHSRYLKETGRSVLLKEGEIPDAYSIHYFGNKTYKLGIDQNMVEQFPKSVLFKLSEWIFRSYPREND